MKKYLPEGKLIYGSENRTAFLSLSALREAMFLGQTLEARALLCDAEHNLHVDLGCMKGIIPREECALGIGEGTVRDIAILSRVNKPVSFKVTEIETGGDGVPYAILSRRALQEECMEKYLSLLQPGDVIAVKITHMEGFGVFCDVGAGISALMPVDSICVSRIPHPNVRFTVGQEIRAVVKGRDEYGRLTLSHKELLGTWSENASLFKIGETVSGVVRSVEKYGVFVELTPNLAGLAEYAEGVKEGMYAAVFIKSIIPERMKIKLIIVDSFTAAYPPGPIKYFSRARHIDRFVYSPPESDRLIESVFGEETAVDDE